MPVVSTYTIGDNVDSIVRTLKLASEDADVVLTTGGLGTTDDDVTRQALAKFLGSKLQLQSEVLEKIRSSFARRGRSMPERDKIQAYMPAGATALENKVGIAPGIAAEYKGKLIFVLPGVPAEMKEMFESNFEFLIKNFEFKIKNSSRQAIVVRKLKCFGASESAIADLIGDVMKRGRNPLINCTAENGVITLHIVATAKDKSKACRMAENDENSLRNTLGNLIYGTGEQTLAEVVGEELARRKKTLAVAESCTGGALAKLITDVAGASRYFTHGWVAYSNQAKIDELGVSKDLIAQYGAVSEQVAKVMADGTKKKAETDFAIGITGIAGSSGGSEQKPVGLVYISVSADNNTEVKRFILPGDRELIRLRAALTGLNMLRLRLLN
jgi:nicotinamide-nucleotide amidase